MTTFHLPRSLPALALVTSLATGVGFLLHESTTASPTPSVKDSARELSRAFRDVARQISPSVVGILATHEAENAQMRFHGQPSPQDPLGERFFGDGDKPRLPQPEMKGQGTGVIVDSDGLIATNNHVVAGASRLEVTLQDGRKLAGEVVGTDPETDLALVRVKEKNLPAAKIGDSTTMEPGDWVIAVGNPFGLDHTVTVGVVSALGRSNIGVASYEDFIQTDAAINPGNSGGPLLNLDGEVIGINTAIRSSNGGSDGISFAVPSATLKSVMPGLEREGRVSRGWLGVNIQPLTPELAESFGARAKQGALISDVLANTPAHAAGLRAGDVILSVNGQTVDGPKELSAAIARLEPGSAAQLVVLRDGAEKDFSVALAERPPKDTLARRELRGVEPDTFGLQLGDLPRGMARQLDVEGGALVHKVEPGSAADDVGLQAGDVILSVGKHDVTSAAGAREALLQLDSGARLLVRSEDGATHWVFLKKGSRE
ncbi:MAG: Do family serine endopeptidase [Planctomycetes bacterium]|nr:Do family serine endopeptidase [Planctomycetota bacterium]